MSRAKVAFLVNLPLGPPTALRTKFSGCLYLAP